jgi:MFS family permease
MRSRRPAAGVWRNHDFMRLWAAQSVSSLGQQITELAIPLTAALLLHASPFQMGLLGYAQYVPYLLIGLFVGVWVDRLKRRRLLIGADVARAALLLTIPVLALLGQLALAELYGVVLAVGTLTVVFDVTYNAYVPALVQPGELVEANAKLGFSSSTAQVVGPTTGGILVQVLTAPYAIVANAMSFCASALFLRGIADSQNRAAPGRAGRTIWAEIHEGLCAVWTDRTQRILMMCSFISNFSLDVNLAVSTLFLVRTIALTPALIGVVYGCYSVGAVVGSLVAGRLSRSLGLGRALVLGQALSGAGAFGMSLSSGSRPLAIVELGTALALWGVGTLVWLVNSMSLRQEITPPRLLGRVMATVRFVSWGIAPIGFLVGGVVGQLAGLRGALMVAGAGILLSVLWLALSPVARLRRSEDARPPGAPATAEAAGV